MTTNDWQVEPARPPGMFWALIRHDIKLRRRRGVVLPRRWRMAYAIAAFVILMVSVTLEGPKAHFYLNAVWYFTFGYPFMTLGISAGRIKREWRNGTSGWWMSLSMPRWQLVLAKAISSFIRALMIYAGTYLAVSILGAYTLVLRGTFNAQTMGQFLLQGLEWNGLLVGAAPFMIAFGVLLAILSSSSARPLAPLMWVVIGGLWWGIFPIAGASNWFAVHGSGQSAAITITPAVFPAIFGSWVLASICLFLSIYLMRRFVDISQA